MTRNLRRLLDADKTEVLLIGTQYQLNKLDGSSFLRVADNDIRSVACARNYYLSLSCPKFISTIEEQILSWSIYDSR